MLPKDLSIADYTYDLPKDRIASYPASPRDRSHLLIYDRGKIKQDIYRYLDRHLTSKDVLVFNDTKVIKSRILFPKSTGAVIEIFCLEPYGDPVDYETVFQQTGSALWKCMIGKAGKWKDKQLAKTITVEGKEVILTAELKDKISDAYVIRLSWAPGSISLGEVMSAAGVTPLPPYIKRSAVKADERNYQTVYSAHKGSVAAPTAGLHFTEEMLGHLHEKKITTLFTTLHVGAGTFKPVKSKTMEGHHMHTEWMNLTIPFLQKLMNRLNKEIISVGTTSMRTLESIYWMGNKILNNNNLAAEELAVSQWEAYKDQPLHPAQQTVKALIEWIKQQHQEHLLIETGIIIAPGYSFQMVKGLITNFHQPQSTLLLLVAALMGEDWRKIYNYALENDFRFLSYGDGCLIRPARQKYRERIRR